ncbi:MAG TPA: class I SAM-dependent methyltransferase [Candidatus Acidoferrum sp.]|nr:class I SAM-dependent methyltransferase [Candidatus Acidoferrum sp.]
MSPVNSNTESAELPKVGYLSPAAEVSMSDRWFEIASINHFWVRRRFEVLQHFCSELLSGASQMAEIGCGHGLLQRQIEDVYGKAVTGFDLNEYGLKHNMSRISRVSCYDIRQRNEEFRDKFDLILLFDVLEHIADEDGFLNALLFHLAPRGKLILNVPAGRWAFSAYDVAAGHLRRYAIGDLVAVARRNGLKIADWTYWGFPLTPTLMIRKLWLMGRRDQRKIITSGFDSRSPWINKALGDLARLEPIPQKLLGTSLMAVSAFSTQEARNSAS